MHISNLKKIVDRRKKRVGRGPGSGKGFHTSGRGQKGQGSRSGFHAQRAFAGDKNTLVKRLPVFRGNKSRQDKPVSIKISRFANKKIFKIDAQIALQVGNAKLVKIVGETNYEGMDLSKFEIAADVIISKILKEKIVAAGGKVE
jgi:large subunit ribosomal protein L15